MVNIIMADKLAANTNLPVLAVAAKEVSAGNLIIGAITKKNWV